MRRISPPCGIDLKQDVLAVKDDALNTQVFPPGTSVNSSPGVASSIGDANVASKKKKGKRKKERLDLPSPRRGMGI